MVGPADGRSGGARLIALATNALAQDTGQDANIE